ncbi:MAG TPA: cupin domain-containing protein [Gemmatimonadales bacterium]|nr:cupin domain-containing protein [Gemmatimonadales bacterium]
MSSIQRPLSGDVLVLDLKDERDRVAGSAAGEPRAHTARTLLKNGPLRVTLVVLAPGGVIPEHQADGPITVQPLEGRIRFTAAGRVHELGPGQLLSAGPGVRHAVASDGGAAFLLTVVRPEAADEPQPAG